MRSRSTSTKTVSSGRVEVHPHAGGHVDGGAHRAVDLARVERERLVRAPRRHAERRERSGRARPRPRPAGARPGRGAPRARARSSPLPNTEASRSRACSQGTRPAPRSTTRPGRACTLTPPRSEQARRRFRPACRRRRAVAALEGDLVVAGEDLVMTAGPAGRASGARREDDLPVLLLVADAHRLRHPPMSAMDDGLPQVRITVCPGASRSNTAR